MVVALTPMVTKDCRGPLRLQGIPCVARLDRIYEMLRAIGRSETAAQQVEISSPWPAPELIAA